MMEPERRQQFTGYARPINPALNTAVQGIELAERLAAGLSDKDDDQLLNALLSDPDACPPLHGKVMTELKALHELEGAKGWARYKVFSGKAYRPKDAAALLKIPGDRRIMVARNVTDIDRIVAEVRTDGPTEVCDVCIAPDCQACTFNDHATRHLPISRGRVVLLFEICTACEFAVTDTAYYNLRSAVLDEQAKLPAGAVILPNPEKPIDPDDPHYGAWA